MVPHESRSHLVVFIHALASRVESQSATGGLLQATGVDVIFPDNSTAVITAKKEVILSTGTIRTPQILELSGIGDPAILKPFGIVNKVNLPGVGTNLQDQ